MNPRHAAALALLLLASCAPTVPTVQESTTRAEAAAYRAEHSATKAEQAADDALNASVQLQKVVDETDRRVWRALDYVEVISRGVRHLGVKPGEGIGACQWSPTQQRLSNGIVVPPCDYLMIPPFESCINAVNGGPCSQVPLAKWERESVRERSSCVNEKAAMVEEARGRLNQISDNNLGTTRMTLEEAFLQALMSATCISVNDPRLSETK